MIGRASVGPELISHCPAGWDPTTELAGIMRTWRRRMNFAFLVLALRVWCPSAAEQNADSTVSSEGQSK